MMHTRYNKQMTDKKKPKDDIFTVDTMSRKKNMDKMKSLKNQDDEDNTLLRLKATGFLNNNGIREV